HLRQILLVALCVLVFFFTVNAPTRIYTLSLHDALPIWAGDDRAGRLHRDREQAGYGQGRRHRGLADRSSHDLVLVSRLPPAPLCSTPRRAHVRVVPDCHSQTPPLPRYPAATAGSTRARPPAPSPWS